MVELLVLELELLVDVAHNQSIFLMVIFFFKGTFPTLVFNVSIHLLPLTLMQSRCNHSAFGCQ